LARPERFELPTTWFVVRGREKLGRIRPLVAVGDARQVKERSQVDASASVNITDNISFSVDAFNLTDAMRAEFENDPSLPRRLDYDGRTYQATLRASF